MIQFQLKEKGEPIGFPVINQRISFTYPTGFEKPSLIIEGLEIQLVRTGADWIGKHKDLFFRLNRNTKDRTRWTFRGWTE